jgi:type I restriction enzyme S subunit
MSNDWFFEKFALIADAPGAVERMRELVLELAVQGKLVSQQQQDESATILLERIHAGSSHTATRRGIRRKDTQANVRPPYQLPNNWTWTTLGTIADWGSGSTPSRGNPEFFGGNITWLKSGELNDNRALVGSEEHVTELAIKQGSFRKNKPGDVLFAMYGATVGKAAILAETAVTNQAVCGCTPCLGVLNTYLFFYLVSQRQKFRNASEGGAQPNFSKDKIVTFPFPLPPLAEQKRIVARVDELMGLCDELEGQQQERELRKSVLVRSSLSRFAESPTRENLGYLFHNSYDIPPSELRKSILTLAVQGKLVSQDPEDEPASSILKATQSFFKRLVAEKKLSEPKPLPLIDDQEEPFSLPPGWEWCRLGHIIRISSGDGLIAKDMVNGPFPVFGGNGVNGYHNQNNVTKRTLVIGRVGFYCGSIHITPAKAWVTDNAFITTFNDENLDLDFLSWLLKATDLRKRDNATAQPVISGAKIYPTVLGLPPLAEQHRIVAKVDQLMALVDELERQQAASREKASNLLDAIVHEMTSGV